MKPILEYTAATSRQIHEGRGELISVNVAGNGADGNMQIYDGMGTGGKQLLHIDVKDGYSHQWKSAEGIKIDRGIYLVANAITTKCTVEYKPLE